MDLGFRLVRVETRIEKPPFFLTALFEGQLRCSLDRINGCELADLVVIFLASIFPGRRENRRIFLWCAQLVAALAGLRNRLPRYLARKSNCSGEQVTLDRPIDQPELRRLARFHGFARRAHLDCLLNSNEPRQTLRSPGSRN